MPISIISIYQKMISPLITPSCRFYPSCSVYAQLAIKRYGILRGGIMTLIRLSKCHPFHPGGYDLP
ncbi:MAG TPA: membrane protein insertion efficiency factor YidD [Desulfatiglandales bacterium]|nr:membrane protein insertion efficiency factor YidD [Desulfatiglandales bacterium]